MGRVLRRKITNTFTLGKKILKQAGIKDEVEVIVEDRRIILLPLPSDDGWELLQQLGKDAGEGKLEDVSEGHDEYLYRKD